MARATNAKLRDTARRCEVITREFFIGFFGGVKLPRGMTLEIFRLVARPLGWAWSLAAAMRLAGLKTRASLLGIFS